LGETDEQRSAGIKSAKIRKNKSPPAVKFGYG